MWEGYPALTHREYRPWNAWEWLNEIFLVMRDTEMNDLTECVAPVWDESQNTLPHWTAERWDAWMRISSYGLAGFIRGYNLTGYAATISEHLSNLIHYGWDEESVRWTVLKGTAGYTPWTKCTYSQAITVWSWLLNELWYGNNNGWGGWDESFFHLLFKDYTLIHIYS